MYVPLGWQVVGVAIVDFFCGLFVWSSSLGKIRTWLSNFVLKTVDGRNPAPFDMYYSLSHYLEGFMHPRGFFGISSINSSSNKLHRMKVLSRWFSRHAKVHVITPYSKVYGSLAARL